MSKRGGIRKRTSTLILCLAIALACWSASTSPIPVSTAAPVQITFDWQGWQDIAGWKFSETFIPMRDGARLATDIYVPPSDSPVPAVLIQTPYNKNASRVAYARGIEQGSSIFFASKAYATVMLDWRNYYNSRETAPPTGMPNQGGLDGFDAVEWVAQQPWCNGKVVTYGNSALGEVQYRTAVEQPPHLIAGGPGVASLHQIGNYVLGGVLRREQINRLPGIGFSVPAWSLRPLDYTYQPTPSFNPANIDVPMLVMGGWFDYNETPLTYNWLRTLGGEQARDLHRLVIGPWTHTGTASAKQGELEFPGTASTFEEERFNFFNFWVTGADRSYADAPPIKYYVMGTNEWRTSTVWPPLGVISNTWYLSSGGTLSQSAPAAAGAATFANDPSNPVPTVGGRGLDPAVPSGPYDQREKVESRSDVLVYTSPILERDLTIAGPASVVLYVSSDKVDTDVAIRLTDVYPDGRSMLVVDSIQRVSVQGTQRVKLVPGEIYKVTVTVPDTAQTFLRGHQIRLDIAASNYPRYDVNKGTGDDFDEAMVVATNTLHHDAAHPSALILPVLPVAPPAKVGRVTVGTQVSTDRDITTVNVSVRNNLASRLGGFEIVATLPTGASLIAASPAPAFGPAGLHWAQPAGLEPGQTASGYQYRFRGGKGSFGAEVSYWSAAGNGSASSESLTIP